MFIDEYRWSIGASLGKSTLSCSRIRTMAHKPSKLLNSLNKPTMFQLFFHFTAMATYMVHYWLQKIPIMNCAQTLRSNYLSMSNCICAGWEGGGRGPTKYQKGCLFQQHSRCWFVSKWWIVHNSGWNNTNIDTVKHEIWLSLLCLGW